MSTQILSHKTNSHNTIEYWQNRIRFAQANLTLFGALIESWQGGNGDASQFETLLWSFDQAGLTQWIDQPQLDALAELVDYNSVTELAAELGTSRATIRNYASELGLQLATATNGNGNGQVAK